MSPLRAWAMTVIATLLASHAGESMAQVSTRLRGVVERGYGEINLLQAGVQSRNLTIAQIESLRRDNNGMLAFAVDVNEAASGRTKATAPSVWQW